MSVADTRARIVIDTQSAQRALENLSRSMGAFEKSLSSSKTNFNGISSGINKVNSDVATLTKSIVSAESAVRSFNAFSNTLSSVFKGAYDYSTNLESNAVGISGILTSMTTLNGKQLEWNKALAISKDIMNDLRTTALQTASTAPELIDTFRALLGPAMGTGMNVQEVMKLTTVGVNAVKSMGLGGQQLVQELRSIIQGSIKPASSTLATALGISNTDIKQAIASSDGLFNFLMKKLKGFEMSVGETSKTIKGRVDILTEALYQSIEKGGNEAFNSIRNALKDLSDRMLVFNDNAKAFELNPRFVEQIEKVSSFAKELIDNVSWFGGKLLDNMSGLTEATVMFLKWETYIGVGGLLISGLSKFKDLWTQARGVISGAVGFLFEIAGAQNNIKKIEAEITNSLKEQKTITKDIDDYNKSVKKSIDDEVNAQKKINSELEKRRNLALDIDAKMNRYVVSGNNYPLEKIRDMRSSGVKAGMNINEINEWIGRYIKEYEKHGARSADVYVTAFKNGLKKYSISDEIKALMQKANTDLSTKDVSSLVSERNKLIGKNVNDPAKIKQLQEIDNAFIKLTETMQKTGQTSNAVSKEYVRSAKEVIQAGGDLSKVNITLTKEQVKQMENNIKTLSLQDKVLGSLGALGVAVSGLGFIYQRTTGDSDSFLGSLAEYAITSGTVITTIGQVGGALKELGTILDITAKKEAILQAIRLGLASPAFLMSVIGATIVGVGYGTYSKWDAFDKKGVNGLTYDGDVVRAKTDEEIRQENIAKGNYVYNDNPMEDMIAQEQQMLAQARKDRKNLKVSGGGNGGETDSKAKREAEWLAKLEERARQARDSYTNLVDTLRIANGELTYSYTEFDKQGDEAIKKADSWRKNLNDIFVQAGGKFNKDKNGNIIGILEEGKVTKKEYQDIIKTIEDFQNLSKQSISVKSREKDNENELQHIQNLHNLGVITTSKMNELKVKAHQDQIALWETEMAKCEADSTKRIELEQKIANARKEIQDASLTDMSIHLDNVMEHIKNTTFNQTEVVKGTFDSILSSFTNLGQNMLVENKRISDRVKDLFRDFANNIINMMMKVIMQGLAMQAILGISKMFTKTPTSIGSTDMDLTKGLNLQYTSISDFGLAKGGYTDGGWHLVGEKGPELVNFSNPARVYTADQTRNALGGGGGNVNVVINLKNESGQDVQAETTGQTFDGENYVIGVVLKAISTNKGNMRNLIKGVAMA